jgi:hypothetical protein
MAHALKGTTMTTKKTAKASHPHKPAHGYDGAGHMDPAHAEHLLELGRETRQTDENVAFVKGTSTNDDLAEELAEAAVTSMNSGEDELTTQLNAEVEEERGGPFTETSGNAEFAGGTDASNIEEATREPFPTANASKKTSARGRARR